MRIEYFKRKISALIEDRNFTTLELVDSVIRDTILTFIDEKSIIVVSIVSENAWYVFGINGIGTYTGEYVFTPYSSINMVDCSALNMLESGKTKAEIDHLYLYLVDGSRLKIRFKDPGIMYSMCGILKHAIVH